ncbi:2'-5' RNA ligase family protein [Actinacidiphila sp. ITFR-21]|uniref:2'-5' RNA ligase family protein n=1 Tax=Actinacidiphila sp. ITFR-21 TaxID=3075199 RepID=UPI00288A00C7|nr:2'-5' RNA ligase family protein [Streptomyces sp. ITFR-21]WNI19742.1 2'-5' RNA ligase family protein [Streptomyces sp. ITFR-21]
MGTTTVGVSIAVPEPYGRLLQDRRASFGDPAACAIPTHVTLLPPTEIGPADLAGFRRHLLRVAAEGRPFPIRLDGTDTFRPVSPVVYVRVAEGGAACAELQERVRSGPLSRELQFPYHPHVTVAHGVPEAALDRAQAELAAFAAAWTAGGFALYVQADDGVWHKSQDFPFAASPPVVPHQQGSRTPTRI